MRSFLIMYPEMGTFLWPAELTHFFGLWLFLWACIAEEFMLIAHKILLDWNWEFEEKPPESQWLCCTMWQDIHIRVWRSVCASCGCHFEALTFKKWQGLLYILWKFYYKFLITIFDLIRAVLIIGFFCTVLYINVCHETFILYFFLHDWPSDTEGGLYEIDIIVYTDGVLSLIEVVCK